MKSQRHQSIIVLLSLAITMFCTSPGFTIRNSTHLYREGTKLALSGNIESAIEKFKESIARNPYYSMGHYGLGKAYLHRPGKIKDAVRHLQKAVQLDSKNARAHFYLGIAYLLDKKMIKAIHAFDDAYRKDAALIESIYNIAAVYDMMGYDSKAFLYFELFLQKKEKTERDILF